MNLRRKDFLIWHVNPSRAQLRMTDDATVLPEE
jgi:hypothetical protein